MAILPPRSARSLLGRGQRWFEIVLDVRLAVRSGHLAVSERVGPGDIVDSRSAEPRIGAMACDLREEGLRNEFAVSSGLAVSSRLVEGLAGQSALCGAVKTVLG